MDSYFAERSLKVLDSKISPWCVHLISGLSEPFPGIDNSDQEDEIRQEQITHFCFRGSKHLKLQDPRVHYSCLVKKIMAYSQPGHRSAAA